MVRWSFGLRRLFFWMAAIALSLVALRSATMTWVAGMLGVAISMLAASVLLAVYRQGTQRAYWSGFATFGWLYLLLVFGSWTLGRMAYDESPLRAHNLFTQQLSKFSYHWLYDKAFENYYASSSAGSNYGQMAGGGYVGAGMPGAVGASDSGYGSSGMISSSGTSMMPGMGGGLGGSAPSFGPPPGPNESDFVNVAHALWTLLFAALGGCLGYWLYATGPGRRESTGAVSS